MGICRKAASVSRAQGLAPLCTYRLGRCNCSHDEAEKKCLEMGMGQGVFFKTHSLKPWEFYNRLFLDILKGHCGQVSFLNKLWICLLEGGR